MTTLFRRFSERERLLTNGIEAELIISKIQRSDSGEVKCIAANSYGRDETLINVVVQGKKKYHIFLREPFLDVFDFLLSISLVINTTSNNMFLILFWSFVLLLWASSNANRQVLYCSTEI